MLYRRLSVARAPNVRRVLANTHNVYLVTAAGFYALNSALPVTTLRIGLNRATTVRVDVQAPGSGGGCGGQTSGKCYAMNAQAFQPGVAGGFGASGLFWTADISRTLLISGSITMGAAGEARDICYGSASFPTTSGGRGGRGQQGTETRQLPNACYRRTKNNPPGGIIGGSVAMSFTGTTFTLPSGGAGGGGGSNTRRQTSLGNAPAAGGNGSNSSVCYNRFNLGDSGAGGVGGSGGGCYAGISTAAVGVTSRGASTPRNNIGTVIAGSGRNIPNHGVSVFTTNQYGQGGLGGAAAAGQYSVNQGSNGNPGAFLVRFIPSTFRF